MSDDEVKALGTFVEHLPEDKDDSQRLRMVLCGDCDWWPSTDAHTCPKCGGPAMPALNTKELKELCTKRLTELFERAGEVRVQVNGRWHFLEDVLGALSIWSPAKQAEFCVAIAFGQDYERWCKKCGNLKPECPCDEVSR